MQYEAALAERGRPFLSVDSEYEDTILQFVIDCEAKLKDYRRRLEQTQGRDPDDPMVVERVLLSSWMFIAFCMLMREGKR